MSTACEAKEVIAALQRKPFYASCPCCEEPILLRNAGLFYLDDFTSEAEALYQERSGAARERAAELRQRRITIPRVSETTTRAVNIGFILERLCPCFKDFCFDRNDCRSLFDPIDYVIFDGLTKTGSIDRIVFADIKTGQARLGKKQKQIKELVTKKKVEWDTYGSMVSL